MRYLKTYESFNNDDILNTIEDILLELYDEGYKIRKSIEIDGDFYTWTRQTYKDEPFKDSVTDDNVEFNGEFDQLNINIQSKGSDIEKTGIHHLEGSVDVDSIKDKLIEIIDYSNSEGYDITLFFGNTSAPFDKKILTQPGYEQFGYTYQTILNWEPSYITMTIHRNTVYELQTFNESTLPEGILINTVKNLEVPEELEDLISRNGYFMNRIIANIDDVWFDYNKGLYSQPEWSHINYSTYIDPNGVKHKATKEEELQIIFDQDVIPGSEKDSESKAFKKWLLSKGLNVKEVYLGET